MELTKRMEKQLNKVFDNPKKLRKWFDKTEQDLKIKLEKEMLDIINDSLKMYSVTVAYTLRYVCGFGKKRLPEIMTRIWNNMESFKEGYITLDDCIQELEENGISQDMIVKKIKKIYWRGDENNVNK